MKHMDGLRRWGAAGSLVVVSTGLLAGCQGTPDGGPGGTGSDTPPTITPGTDGRFSCTPGQAPSATPLRRLSMLQYRNSVNDLFGGVPGLDLDTVTRAPMGRLPADDTGQATYAGMDDRLSDRHVQGFYDVSDAVAGAVARDDAALGAIAGSCAASTMASTACIDAFPDDFALRAFRRPLTAEERTRYHALNDGSRDGREVFRALVFSILMAPQFLYHVEVDGRPLGAETHLALSPYEIASRLSFHFWQSAPDAELLAAAADGSLATEAGYAEQMQRVFEDDRTRSTAETFYREWLQVGVVTIRPGAAVNALATDAGIVGREDAYLAAAADEISDLTAHYTWDAPGSLRDLLRSDITFTDDADLARIYGVAPWDGGSDPVTLPAGERSGLLSRAAFLVSGNHTTHPIHRGFNVRRRLLCETLAAPPPSALPEGSLVPPPQDATQTTRERYAHKVANEPCASCHRQMNPIGYVLEQYDGLGRFRTEETVYDDATGEVLATLPIDSISIPHITPGDERSAGTAAELTELVVESGRTESCFAMNYFRFTHHRLETATDGCALEAVRSALADGNLRDALFAIAMDPSFRERTVQ